MMVRPMRRSLPSGTVTFLFTDVEGSTKLLAELGAERYADALAEHRRLIREACASEGGVEVDTQGDAFFFAFPTAPGALAAASALTERLAADGPIRVRVGLHTGTPLLGEEGYVGTDVHRAARIAAAGHGGQVLVSQSTASLVEDDLRDLGEQRLKDLSAPERIYQLGRRDFPALKTLRQTNLPIPATPFLGRELELSEVTRLLARPEVRLLTLAGPGGIGKTRLAAQAAGAVGDRFPAGVFWVPLSLLRDPALVLDAAERALGARTELVEHIGDRHLLLLFDNFEHVVDAAPELASLLERCPNLELLVTSREPLHLAAEHEYPVPPLAHDESIGFFLARARAVKPDFELDDAVSEICHRLDELPLALELAAARVKALSASQILERLERRLPLLTSGARDAPERQRTLTATIAWSHDLLTDEEQILLRRLSVFAGGCTLDAAEEVAGADLDTLLSLVDKSLLRHSAERYSMLETIREYAAERLGESGELEELRRRHAETYLALATNAAPELRRFGGRELSRARDAIAVESDNLDAALQWALERDADDVAELLALVLARHWVALGHVSSPRALLEIALGRCSSAESEAELRALLSSTQFSAGEDVPAYGNGEHAYALVRDLEPSLLKVAVTLQFARLHWLLVDRDPADAIPLAERAVADAEALGDSHAYIGATVGLAGALSWNGETERGLERLREAYRRALGTGDLRLIVSTYESLCTSLFFDPAARRGEPARVAEEVLTRVSLEELGRLSSGSGWTMWVLLLSGQWARAEELADALGRTYMEAFDRVGYLLTRAALRWMQGRLEEAGSDLAELRELPISRRWYHDYLPLAADVAADAGRLPEVRALAGEFLSLDVDSTEEAKKVAVLSSLARAEVNAALAASGSEHEEHVECARAAVARGRAILARFPPTSAGSVQMETPATYLALAESELSRATGPSPDLWRDVASSVDYVYFRMYAQLRLAEALLETGRPEEAEAALRPAHDEASRLGADGLRDQLEALATQAGLVL
jgi:predicted ATPase/class 3 adenylate cyclase